MKIKEKVIKIVEIQREDIETRIIEFHQDMLCDSINAGENVNGDELIWQLDEFKKNLMFIKEGNFREIISGGYTMCALGGECFEYIEKFFESKEKFKDPAFLNQELLLRVMDGDVFIQDIKESDINY